MAADAINSNNSILSNYHLEILSQDGQCSADEVMKSFINYVTNATFSTMVGILGKSSKAYKVQVMNNELRKTG